MSISDSPCDNVEGHVFEVFWEDVRVKLLCYFLVLVNIVTLRSCSLLVTLIDLENGFVDDQEARASFPFLEATRLHRSRRFFAEMAFFSFSSSPAFFFLFFFTRHLVPVRASPVPSVVRGSFVVKLFFTQQAKRGRRLLLVEAVVLTEACCAKYKRIYKLVEVSVLEQREPAPADTTKLRITKGNPAK